MRIILIVPLVLGLLIGIDEAHSTAMSLPNPIPMLSEGFGAGLAIGDINNDGYDDVVVSPQFSDENDVFVFMGPGLSRYTALEIPRFEHNTRIDQIHVADINNDNYADILIGEVKYTGKGRVQIFFGPELNQSPTILTVPEDTMLYGLFGQNIKTGDINGDGHKEIIVSSKWDHFDSIDYRYTGSVHVFHGPSFENSSKVIEDYPEKSAMFGTGISVGDINDDGFDDVIIGAPKSKILGTMNGEVHVFLGPDMNPMDRQLRNPNVYTSERIDDEGPHFGQFLTTGDVNGDGFDDVIVSAPFVGKGEVFAFFGPELHRQEVVMLETDYVDEGDEFGNDLVVADVNGDGNYEVIIGAPRADSVMVQVVNTPTTITIMNMSGQAFVFAGPELENLVSGRTLKDPTPQNHQYIELGFGTPIAVGDINNDSFSDIAIAATSATVNGEINAGEVFVLFGPNLEQDFQTSPQLVQPLPIPDMQTPDDVDRDGIFNQVDVFPYTYSNEFTDTYVGGTTFGNIVSRNSHSLIIKDEPFPEGVRITSEGGAIPAELMVCENTIVFLENNEKIIATCGSSIVKVISGYVTFEFIGTNGNVAIANIAQGNGIKFESETMVFEALNENSEPITIRYMDSEHIIYPGEKQIIPEFGSLTIIVLVASTIALLVASRSKIHYRL